MSLTLQEMWVIIYTLYPSIGTKAKLIKYGEAVEIVFQGTNIGNAENHLMHLHGFSFYLVGTGYGNFDNVTSPQTKAI
jgi:laccase